MTYAEAVEIRKRQLQLQWVHPAQAAEALLVLKGGETKPNRAEYETARRVAPPFYAAAIVQTKGRTGARMVPVQVVDFYKGKA